MKLNVELVKELQKMFRESIADIFVLPESGKHATETKYGSSKASRFQVRPICGLEAVAPELRFLLQCWNISTSPSRTAQPRPQSFDLGAVLRHSVGLAARMTWLSSMSSVAKEFISLIGGELVAVQDHFFDQAMVALVAEMVPPHATPHHTHNPHPPPPPAQLCRIPDVEISSCHACASLTR